MSEFTDHEDFMMHLYHEKENGNWEEFIGDIGTLKQFDQHDNKIPSIKQRLTPDWELRAVENFREFYSQRLIILPADLYTKGDYLTPTRKEK